MSKRCRDVCILYLPNHLFRIYFPTRLPAPLLLLYASSPTCQFRKVGKTSIATIFRIPPLLSSPRIKCCRLAPCLCSTAGQRSTLCSLTDLYIVTVTTKSRWAAAAVSRQRHLQVLASRSEETTTWQDTGDSSASYYVEAIKRSVVVSVILRYSASPQDALSCLVFSCKARHCRSKG